ncbi:MAG: hypothetical protein U0W94_02095 [Buchnera aphidicola (Schlechtendalia peitan)]
MGFDNLITLNKWYKWTELLKWCHLIILTRTVHKKYIMNNTLKHWIRINTTKNCLLLHKSPSGYIFFANTPNINISSTKIRALLKNNSYYSHFLPISVANYIKKHKLYF